MNRQEKHKKAGFEVPEGYFSKLAQQLKAVGSDDATKSTGFNVPDGYFQQQRSGLYDIAASQSEPAVVSLNSRYKIVPAILAVAASIAALFAIFNSDAQATSFEQIPTDELADYLLKDTSYQTNQLTYELYKEQDSLLDNQIDLEFTDAELQHYLMEDIDLLEIYTE